MNAPADGAAAEGQKGGSGILKMAIGATQATVQFLIRERIALGECVCANDVCELRSMIRRSSAAVATSREGRR